MNIISVDAEHSSEQNLHILFLNALDPPLFAYLTLKSLFQYVKSQILKIECNSQSKRQVLLQSIRMRDLRILCDTENYQAPRVTIRRFVMIITVVPIRAVLLPNQLILVLPQGADNFIDILERNIAEWKDEQSISSSESYDDHRDGDKADSKESYIDSSNVTSSYDECAIFSILSTIISINKENCNLYRKQTREILTQIKENESIITKLESQESIRALKSKLANQIEVISDLTTFLNELLDDDEELALMALTKFVNHPSHYELPLSDSMVQENHEAIEKLLYPFLIDCYSLQANVDELRGDIRNAEELVKLRLDISRNRLLLANTIISLLGTNFALAAFLTGIFGMNLDNQGLNMFTIISVAIVALLVVLIVTSLICLKRSGALPY